MVVNYLQPDGLGMKALEINMTSSNFCIQLSDIAKQYTIHHEKPTLVERLMQRKTEKFFALKNISLKIKKGERVGIIGTNGSGKTTLLKIISGITTPTVGKVEILGKIVSLIDLEAGFHPDLSGVDNIFLNGLILGMNKQVIRKRLEDIIAFAGIGKFIDAPLFTYSGGMKLRLGFSVAIHADPDILILDEIVSAGDENFQKKSQEFLKRFFQSGKTIVIVSHWLDFIRRNCEKVFVFDKGQLYTQGNTSAVDRYLRLLKTKRKAA